MLKEEKGVLLVPLVLVIIVLIIIGAVAVSVLFQNTDELDRKGNVASSSETTKTPYEDAQTKVKLIFELCEANYQAELAKGNVTNRDEVFTADNLVNMLKKYDVTGNTNVTLGEIDLISGVTVNYGEEYTFLVRVSNSGVVTVLEQ